MVDTGSQTLDHLRATLRALSAREIAGVADAAAFLEEAWPAASAYVAARERLAELDPAAFETFQTGSDDMGDVEAALRERFRTAYAVLKPVCGDDGIDWAGLV